jgi:hypothetical protein
MLSPRIISSLFWMAVLLFPPTCLLMEGLTLALWPNVPPFTYLMAIHPVWAPLAIILVAGYFGVYFASKWALAASEDLQRFLSETDKKAKQVFLPLAVTACWLVLASIFGGVSFPLFVCALFVFVGFLGELNPFSPLPTPSPLPIPSPPPVPPLPLPSREEEEILGDKETETEFIRNYSWLFNEEPFLKTGHTKRLTFNVRIPKSRYEELRARNHTPRSDHDYVGFADAQLDDETVASVASFLRQTKETKGYDELTEIHLAMSFTMCMPYANDQVDYGREYPKFPVEMLVDKKGDCEDFSILCSTLLHRLGYRVALVLMGFADSSTEHAAIGVVPPQPVPVPGYQLPCRELRADVLLCEVTPPLQATTSTDASVLWGIGQSDWNNARNFRVFPLGLS